MPMTVLSDSMKPEFAEGDLILVKAAEEGYEYKVDDVVSFYFPLPYYSFKT
ncbi:MAG: S26 family signal peptidase [Firmicutes bacterium]|nr:S26 family signal peptidase [Bacillota bacterium]